MKPIDELIVRVRRETRNATTGSTTAGASIDDAEFADRLNDAQEMAVELISGLFSTYFEKTTTYTIDTSVADYEVLALPSDLLLTSRIASVEYAYSGDLADFINIYPADIRERFTGSSFVRSDMKYILTGESIILTEKPKNNSKIRLVYERRIPRLDITKGDVATGSRSGTDYTGTFGALTSEATAWVVGTPVTIIDSSVDRVLIYDAVFSAITASTGGAFTIDLTNATYTDAAVDAATATNLKLIEGGRSSISELPDYCEKYLIAYAVMDIFGRDGSRLAGKAERRFMKIQESLTKSFLTFSKDWPTIGEEDY